MKHTPADVLRSALVWAGFAGVVLMAVPPMVLGYPLVLVDRKRAGADRYFRAIARALVKLNPMWSVNVEGTRHLSFDGPFVLVVNHQSMADLIAMCFLGHDTKYLGKQAAFRVPVFGWALRIAGEVPVERGNKESGARALEALGEWLDNGVSVAIFPEGTRTSDGTLGAFKMGAFRLAIDHQRPVVPIVISGARDLLPKSSFVMKGRADV
jgi:1-acyl-sn-glycerol-3-phosphate acyltransferase